MYEAADLGDFCPSFASTPLKSRLEATSPAINLYGSPSRDSPGILTVSANGKDGDVRTPIREFELPRKHGASKAQFDGAYLSSESPVCTLSSSCPSQSQLQVQSRPYRGKWVGASDPSDPPCTSVGSHRPPSIRCVRPSHVYTEGFFLPDSSDVNCFLLSKEQQRRVLDTQLKSDTKRVCAQAFRNRSESSQAMQYPMSSMHCNNSERTSYPVYYFQTQEKQKKVEGRQQTISIDSLIHSLKDLPETFVKPSPVRRVATPVKEHLSDGCMPYASQSDIYRFGECPEDASRSKSLKDEPTSTTSRYRCHFLGASGSSSGRPLDIDRQKLSVSQETKTTSDTPFGSGTATAPNNNTEWANLEAKALQCELSTIFSDSGNVLSSSRNDLADSGFDDKFRRLTDDLSKSREEFSSSSECSSDFGREPKCSAENYPAHNSPCTTQSAATSCRLHLQPAYQASRPCEKICSAAPGKDSAEHDEVTKEAHVGVIGGNDDGRDGCDDVEADSCAGDDRPSSKVHRKPVTPQRSASPSDPKFSGVTFHMRTEVQQNNNVQLSIKAFFNCRKSKLSKKEHPRMGTIPVKDSVDLTSSSDSDCAVELFPRKRRRAQRSDIGKQCVSCGTKTTPLWRDAEDGTPLCNACGIRYKKYHIRCTRCWYIPRKENKSNLLCRNCGETLKFSCLKTKQWKC